MRAACFRVDPKEDQEDSERTQVVGVLFDAVL